jgi:hypothetical protein
VIELLQRAVDDLARRLHRSVAIDDAELKLLVHTTHFQDADEARLSTLANRESDAAFRAYVVGQGALDWAEPHTVPPRKDIGLRSGRIAIPLRSEFGLLGFMWLIDDGTLSDAVLGRAVVTAREVVEIMASSEVSTDRDLRSATQLGALRSGSGPARARAARALLELGFFGGSRSLVAVLTSVDTHAVEDHRIGLEATRRAVRAAARRAGVESSVVGVEATEVASIVGWRTPVAIAECRELGAFVQVEVCRALTVAPTDVVVGIGGPYGDLEGAASSFAQAAVAARIARSSAGSPVAWGESLLEDVLAATLVTDVEARALPPALLAWESRRGVEDLAVLRSFLDNAGNVSRVATEVRLHRSSVYHRLSKFRAMTGIDLGDGSARLALHLWIRSRPYIRIHE